MDSSSLEGCEDNKWLNFPASGGDGNDEWGFIYWFSIVHMVFGNNHDCR